MATSQKVSAAHQRLFDRFLEERGDKPFRRQDIADVLYPHLRPRTMGAACNLADVFLRQLKSANRLTKAGHVHWQLIVPTERTLKGGRQVQEHADAKDLTLTTRCPEKWACIDLETGEVWGGSDRGWLKASDVVCREAAAVLRTRVDQLKGTGA
ncbi:hypothetical protein WJ96_05995 [Burkholderia ubonensis]|uniref:Uncharacterized protein n=1 Tax=Burkholderia ubonensis TaxID=101571 RepID=A0AAW3MY50_9BURK|nr:hypothetical protein [Burkholderia ubonensis]KVP75308.1 hypothetical protein WJ93_07790 [Burkholderia ubonensis]KVP98121.1 hypothetical protein WJ96_05995 [Burkholderia ubonensis]KVZ92818.1 hypothetical protein WL25_17655 [Burkholderia ubonensis]